MNDDDYVELVNTMRTNESEHQKQTIIDKIQHTTELIDKCILCRYYLSPLSTNMEKILRNDLQIGGPLNNTSGDGHKNGVNYEIKYSGHTKRSTLNFVQIRPDHDIDYYILVCYNMYAGDKGSAHILKVPANDVYDMVVKYGEYAHGTKKHLGAIDKSSLTGNNNEYSLRCNPNTKKGKNHDLWNILRAYEVTYSPENF